MRLALFAVLALSAVALAAPAKKVKIIQVKPMHAHHVAKVSHAKKKAAAQAK